jgi:hypothetical protein
MISTYVLWRIFCCELYNAFELQANVGREKEFHASLQKLRGEDADVSEEAIEIKVGFFLNRLYMLEFVM